MDRYSGINCPICNNEFKKEDNIVVCPECGAPFHKSCYLKQGKCIYFDKHGDFVWEFAKTDKTNDNLQNKCSRCGGPNKNGVLFCEFCGMPLIDSNIQQQNHQNQNFNNFTSNNFYKDNNEYNKNSSVDSDEKIEGISIRELQLYLGDNSTYFINNFKQLKDSNLSVNWPSIFLGFYYFIYRKMWGLAIVSFIISFGLSLPSFIYNFKLLIFNQTMDNSQNYLTLFAIISYFFRIIFGLITNKLYMHHVIRKINKIKKLYGNNQMYNQMLIKSGSVSKAGVLVAVCSYFAFLFFITMILFLIFA